MVKAKKDDDVMPATEAVKTLALIARGARALRHLEDVGEVLRSAAQAENLVADAQKELDSVNAKISEKIDELARMQVEVDKYNADAVTKHEEMLANQKEEIKKIENEKERKRQAALKEQEDINEAVRSLRAHYASEEQKTKEMLAAFSSQIEQKKQELQQVKDQMHKLATGLSNVA